MKDVKESIVENYRKCLKFGKECEWFFVFAFGVFVLTFLVGFAYPLFFREEIIELIKMLVMEIGDKGTLELIHFIFLNNLKASFMAMILGVFLGVFPLITALVNGYLLGFVARETVVADGIFALWKILPHGIFELPAVIFSIGIGLRIGLSFGKKNGVGYVFREGLRFFAFVVFPLLIVAGIVEGILIGLSV